MKRDIFILFFFIVIFGCTEGRNVRGIYVSREMIDGGDMKGIDYCLSYGNALDGDYRSIRDFSTLRNFDGGFIYVHGVYLIRLIDRVGENKFLKAIEGFNKDEKSRIGLYIEAGMDIYEKYYTGEGKVEYASIEDFWDKHPKISLFINKKYVLVGRESEGNGE